MALWIAVFTAITFAALLLWALIYGFSWQYPRGPRYHGAYEGFRCTVVTSEVLLAPHVIAQHGARAAYWLAKSWSARYGEDASKWIRRFVVYFPADADFAGLEKSQPTLNKAAAYSTYVYRRIGGARLPMAVIRPKYVEDLQARGEPLIHELCHELQFQSTKDAGTYGVHDYQHQDPGVWEASGGEQAVQARARALF